MGCVTLTSDLGLQDASAASARGIMIQHIPGAEIVDISHQVEPYHLQQAAYILSASFPHFPAATCHIALCDIFSERSPVMLLSEKQGHYFIAPDNGILSLMFGTATGDVYRYYQLPGNGRFKDWLHEAAKLAGLLQEKNPAQLALEIITPKHASAQWQPKVDGNTVECHVIHIDRFENVVLNITKDEFFTIGKGRPFTIKFARDETISEISSNYHDVRKGEKLCRFNTAGYLEICINKGNAAGLFGLTMYREQHLIYKTIKIYFS